MPEPRELLRRIHDAAIAAVDPATAIRASLTRDPLDLAEIGRVVVIGAGKATAPMAAALEALLGPRISGGTVVVKYGHGVHLDRITLYEAAHPVPDAAGEAGARAIEANLVDLDANDLVLACMSGGASALLPAPRQGLDLADKQAVNRLLLASGAPIEEINAVRKHCSRLKGGQLARAAAPARLEAFILSDVIGDDLATIASGPTVPDPSTFTDVAAILAKHRLMDRLPPAVTALLAAGLRGEIAETPKPGDPCFARIRNRLIGSNRQACEAAAAAATALGLDPVILADPIAGEARDAAKAFCARATTLAAGSSRPRLLIAGGEPTVTLGADPGQGGRAQEFALACTLALDGHPGIHVLAAGTDGNDGPTDAAGGFADGKGMERAARAGIDPRGHLARHDAYPLLAAIGDLHRTGPTRTNVMDVYLALVS